MTSIEQLLALEDIKALKARYCRLMDTKLWDAWGEVFAEDALMDVSDDVDESVAPPFISGRGAIVAQVRTLVDAAKTTHHVHSPEITFESDVAATGIWAMQDRVVWKAGEAPIPVLALTGYGHYHERYIKFDGRWLIASLKLSRLNLEFEPLPA
ncbi:MAG: nuclear transport factor 2 family protein [Janthinobacterium lividum]